MEEILSHFSVKALKNSVSLPVHEPISFGFGEIVKAKAEADAELQKRLIELALGIGDGYIGIGEDHGGVPYRTSGHSTDVSMTEEKHREYIYDYNIVAELSEIRRRKNRR